MPDPKSSKTAENKDSRRVAADFVDLWQDQVGALADDRSLSEALESMLTMLDRGTMPDSANAGPDHDGDEKIEPSGDATGGGGPARAAAPGPASGDDMEHIDELRRRIAECQSRIAALES